jgi:methionyl-tRNA synthetase
MSKFYITTTLPYVNSRPHIGFALEIIQTDVIARYRRNMGDEVFFNTGTDEHGSKIYRKAKEKGVSPQEFCDENASEFKKLKGILNLSYDNFIRTTDDDHIKAAQEFWKRCNENGDIYKKKYKIKYCPGCELEKTESELVNGKCPLHPNQEMEIIEEENYFFRYSNFQERLMKLYEKNPDFVVPKSRLQEIKEFTKKGLKDFSISRLKEKMPWGIPVPGDEDQVMYVWFDALVNYISCLGWPDNVKKFNDFWPGMQTAGKDNLRQQSSMWQAMLMSAGLKPSKQIFIHGFITSGNQKMSKSSGNVIDPFETVEKYGVDAVRYFLLREIPSTEDGDFTYDKLESRYNSDLAKGLGNLVSRVSAMAENLDFGSQDSNLEVKEKIESAWEGYKKALDNFKFNEGLMVVWELISFCDSLIEKERPWENSEDKKQVIFDLVFSIKNIALMISPFLPDTSEKILEIIGTGKDEKSNSFKVKKGKYLFPRI